MDLSDEDILRQVHKGDKNAYMTLFERHYARVESYARRRMNNAEAARDIASETFLRAYRAVDSFRIDEGVPYLGYLLLICRRLILTEQGRQRILMTHSLEENPAVADTLMDMEPLPLDRLLDSERDEILREALDHLSVDDREIIHLAFQDGLSRRDIGTILNKPTVSAVTSHLHRAISKLKGIITRQGYFAMEQNSGRK